MVGDSWRLVWVRRGSHLHQLHYLGPDSRRAVVAVPGDRLTPALLDRLPALLEQLPTLTSIRVGG